MKLSDVKTAIEAKHGYLVHFEKIEGSTLAADYFPEASSGEEPFETVEDAVAMGAEYAKATKGKTCNFYLVRSDNFKPVNGWNLPNR
jgi:hypothetical protein